MINDLLFFWLTWLGMGLVFCIIAVALMASMEASRPFKDRYSHKAYVFVVFALSGPIGLAGFLLVSFVYWVVPAIDRHVLRKL